MARIKLDSIYIRNWASITEAEIKFPDHGLVFVAGVNSVNANKYNSIGAGKTALGEALSRTLLGVNGRYPRLGGYSRHDKGDTLVRLKVTDSGKNLIIESGYRCKELSKTGEALRYSTGADFIQRATIAETRQEIQNMFNISPRAASWTIHIDGGKLNFNSLSESDSVAVITEILRQPPISIYYDRARKILGNLKKELNEITGSLSEAKEQVKRAQTLISEAESQLVREQKRYEQAIIALSAERSRLEAKITELNAELSDLIAKQKNIAQELKAAEEIDSVAYHQLECRRLEIVSDLAKLRDSGNKLLVQSTGINHDIKSQNKTLNEFLSLPETCPTCGQKLPNNRDKVSDNIDKTKLKIAELTSAKQTLDEQLAEVNSNISKLDSESVEINLEIKKLHKSSKANTLGTEAKNVESRLSMLGREINSLEYQLQRLSVSDSDVERAKSVLEDRRLSLATALNNVKTLEDKILDSSTMVSISEYWSKAFSPTGIPNMVLNEVIGPLNDVSRRVSFAITGGNIQVKYATSRKLVSGVDSNELTMAVTNLSGSSSVLGSSKGEGGLLNLIAAETFSELGNIASIVGYRWYDEVTTSQDESVRRSIFTYLKDIANKYKILVFVVDHSPEVANYSDFKLTAIKTKDGTKFEWS